MAMAAALVCLAASLMRCSSSSLSDMRMRSAGSSLRLGKNSCVLRTLCLRGGSGAPGAPRMGDNEAVPLVRPMGGLRRTNSYSALNEILLTGEKSGHSGETEAPAPVVEESRQEASFERASRFDQIDQHSFDLICKLRPGGVREKVEINPNLTLAGSSVPEPVAELQLPEGEKLSIIIVSSV
jgi:hypothetical protein